MTRLRRVVAVNVPHHLTQRSNARQYILDRDEDRAVYLKLVRENDQSPDDRSYLHGSYPVNPALARTDTIQTVRAIYLCLAQAQASQPFQVHRTPQSLMSLYISGAQLQSREAALVRRPA